MAPPAHGVGRVPGRLALLRRASALLLLCALASCGGHARLANSGSSAYPHYATPGPAGDPWGPFIREASARYAVPEKWIREVMRVESGGQQYRHGGPITSDAGATGLMQLMPATYAELRDRYGLGNDPYDPHDNIMAGTAYIGELYKAYGSPAFLAAYNAGPHRLEAYIAGSSSLPNATVDYLASIAPRLGGDRPLTGPLAAYGDGGQTVEVAQAQPYTSPAYANPTYASPAYAARDTGTPPATPYESGPVRAPVVLRPPSAVIPKTYVRPPPHGCWQDPDAAYDPDAPCRAGPPERAIAQAPPPALARFAQAETRNVSSTGPTMAGSTLWGSRLAIAAPPARQSAPMTAAAEPQHPARQRFAFIPSASASTIQPPVVTGAWAVQVGAFANPDQARAVADTARSRAPRDLAGTRTALGTTTPFGGQVLYRARLLPLSAAAAAAACSALTAQRFACVTVPPGG